MSINNDEKFDYNGKKIWITGHKGMLGSALVRSFSSLNANLLLASSQELDLRKQNDVDEWVLCHKPDIIFHAGAKVGGIYANSIYPGDFLRDNLLIQTNVIDAAYRFGVKKLLFVASNCTYPSKAIQPILEDSLLTGELEENIRSYAVAKIAGIEMCRAYKKQFGCNFASVIPPNLYGPGDNYHPQNSHVVAGILRRAHEAKAAGCDELIIWGDGTARREILYVDDLASAMKLLMSKQLDYDLYNVGYGDDFSIHQIAEMIVDVTGFKGSIVYDKSKPNGTMRKLLSSQRVKDLGWSPVVSASEGLGLAYKDFLSKLNAQVQLDRI